MHWVESHFRTGVKINSNKKKTSKENPWLHRAKRSEVAAWAWSCCWGCVSAVVVSNQWEDSVSAGKLEAWEEILKKSKHGIWGTEISFCDIAKKAEGKCHWTRPEMRDRGSVLDARGQCMLSQTLGCHWTVFSMTTVWFKFLKETSGCIVENQF